MADHTHIEWTDATWNPITGCRVVSEGCRNCYAMRLAGTRLAHHPSRAGLTRQTADGRHVWTGEVRLNAEWLDQPLRWRRPRQIFVCAHGDLFAEGVPDEWLDKVFRVMARAPQHTFQVLTKRPKRMRDYLTRFKPAATGHPEDPEGHRPYITRDGVAASSREDGSPLFHASEGWPLPNVWLGVSVEDQATADARIPLLLETPAAVRWISAEPLLGPVDLYNGDPDPRLDGHCATQTFIGDWWERGDDPKGPPRHGVDWVVVGGESGPGSRPMHPDWARSLRDQCAAAGTAFFMKQMAKKAPIPLDLMVREYPDAR